MIDKEESVLISLQSLLDQYHEIVIPSIQRDYVMGNSKDIYKRLKDDMYKSKSKGILNFGCIVGSCDNSDKKCFYVYDGQQRIVTLVFLVAYKLSQELKYKNDINLKKPFFDLIRKFRFENRENANCFLHNILNNIELEMNDINDLSTTSIIALIKNSEDLYLDAEYLFTKVKFKIEEVNKKRSCAKIIVLQYMDIFLQISTPEKSWII